MGSSIRGERHEGDRPRPLDRLLQLALMGGARAGDPAWKDLPALGDVALQQPDILVVDERNPLLAELAELAPSEEELLAGGPLRSRRRLHARPPSSSISSSIPGSSTTPA